MSLVSFGGVGLSDRLRRCTMAASAGLAVEDAPSAAAAVHETWGAASGECEVVCGAESLPVGVGRE